MIIFMRNILKYFLKNERKSKVMLINKMYPKNNWKNSKNSFDLILSFINYFFELLKPFFNYFIIILELIKDGD